MSFYLAPEVPAPGFIFNDYSRNALLAENGFSAPQATKTGTTIVGIIYEDGVILGADTRATVESAVSKTYQVTDKNCKKIHYLAANMYCCGAGTAADTEKATQTVASHLELHRLHTGRIVPVVTAATLLKRLLFRYQGEIGAALVVGGIDRNGPHIYCIYPHGSIDELPYATMGSGSLVAMALFESQWKKNLTEEQGKKLVRDAIVTGIFNDLGSGSNVDICILRSSGPAQYLRTYETVNIKGKKEGHYNIKPGTTAILKQRVIPMQVESVKVIPTQPMDEEPSTSRR